MSSRRSFSRESRSHYSRSSSCDNNNRFQSSLSYHRRPLSSLLIERDLSSPSSLAFDRFDDPFFFDRPLRRIFDDYDFDRRFRWRWNDDDDFFRNDRLEFGRNIPVNYQSSNVTRNIPVQYSPSSWNQQDRNYYRSSDQGNTWSSNSFSNREGFQSRENRFSSDDWQPMRQQPPTRKRTSMTIFVRPARVQYSDVPNYQQTSSSNYSSTYRTTY